MFLSKNKKNDVYPCKPQFYYIKVGFKGVKIIYACFRDEGYQVCDLELQLRARQYENDSPTDEMGTFEATPEK